MDVVEILAGIVEHAGILAVARLDDLFESLALEARAGQQLVQIVDISLVVLVVMILQRFGRHVGLQGVIGVWKFR